MLCFGAEMAIRSSLFIVSFLSEAIIDTAQK